MPPLIRAPVHDDLLRGQRRVYGYAQRQELLVFVQNIFPVRILQQYGTVEHHAGLFRDGIIGPLVVIPVFLTSAAQAQGKADFTGDSFAGNVSDAGLRLPILPLLIQGAPIPGREGTPVPLAGGPKNVHLLDVTQVCDRQEKPEPRELGVVIFGRDAFGRDKLNFVHVCFFWRRPR